MNAKAFSAVFKRDFVGYFTSPISYVFLSVFSLLFVLAALWPSESYPANLDQLPLVLVFAFVTLGFVVTLLLNAWTEEETLQIAEALRGVPPGDLGTALGKCLGRYLAAVAIYSAWLVAALIPVYCLSLVSTIFEATFIGSGFLGSCTGYWFAGLVVLAVGSMTSPVLRAVLKRNFVSYFSNPTGYVFICVFVLLSAFTTFWPNEFFNTNLANLDQLSKWFPFIMLIFIPAITMSIWAEERSQGTDELLLTIPASDLDVVLGKYLAAVTIYTVALLFSLICNFAVLRTLGNPDGGLFLATYLGYWLVGLAMLAFGLVASFLTKNLTIGYVLGALFNVPLVLAVFADSVVGIFGRELALVIKHWSIGEQFGDFGRGILSLSGLSYFAIIMAVMLYLSMVLIGRRHWGPAHFRIPMFVVYPLVVLVWMVVSACFCVFFVIFWFLAQLILGFQITSGLHLGLLLIGTFLVMFYPAYLFVRFAVRQGWSWFPRRVPWMLVHYMGRTLALAVIAVALIGIFERYDRRFDATDEQLSSLAPDTVKLLGELRPERPVQIEAFISPTVPESYVQTRMDLLAMLRELEARGGGKVTLRVNRTEESTGEAARAEQQYDITARPVASMSGGTFTRDEIFLGVAFNCGLEKVILPFIDRGIPVEYELVRSIATVTQRKRKTVGVLQTDAKLYGGFSMQGNTPNWPIIEELEKQYEVVQVSADELGTYNYARRLEDRGPLEERAGEIRQELAQLKPDQEDKRNELRTELEEIESKLDGELKIYDVLLAVQPSSLGPGQAANPQMPPMGARQMDDFIEVVRSGQPTAIFEDPFPRFAGNVPATTAPRRTPGGMQAMMMGQRPPPKSTEDQRRRLWTALGLDFAEDQIIWQKYNPYPPLSDLEDEFVFIDKGMGVDEPFGQSDPISSDLQHMLFPFPGSLTGLNASDLEFTPLVRTGNENSGTVRVDEIIQMTPFGPTREINPYRRQIPGNISYVLAAHVRGKPAADEEGGEAKRGPEINVVLVADIDILHAQFFWLREQGKIPGAGLHFDFDNVTLVLNVLDSLAGDTRFLELRKRRPIHRTLVRVDESTEQARKKTAEDREKFQDEFDKIKDKEEEILREKMDKLEKRMQREKIDLNEIGRRVQTALKTGQQRMEAKIEQLERERDRKIRKTETDLRVTIRRVQDTYKMWAVLLPPIPPLMLAVIVFFTRRVREREGIARSRLRS